MLRHVSYFLMAISALGSVVACTRGPSASRSAISQSASILEAPQRTTASTKKPAESCGLKLFTASFKARETTPEEQNRVLLPYDSYPEPVRTVQIGDSTGADENGTPYAQDAQVLFSIDLLNLPPKASIAKFAANLKMTVTEVSKDGVLGHQMLCFLDEAICSGEYVEDRQDNINLNFFRESGGPVNGFFAKQPLARSVGHVDENGLFRGEVTLGLKELLNPDEHSRFRGFTSLTDLNLIYGENTPATQPLEKRVLHLAVAADTLVAKDATLALSMIVDTCKTAEANP